MLLLSVYIDVNPRREVITPQLVRPTLLESSAPVDQGKSKTKKLEWKNVTPDTEIWRNSAQQELQGPSGDNFLPNVVVSEEEVNLTVQLKSDILKYLYEDIYKGLEKAPEDSKSQKKSRRNSENAQITIQFDKYLLNIVSLAKKMAIFGLYCSQTYNDLRGERLFHKEIVSFSFREKRDKFLARSELAQLIYLLFPILFMEGSELKSEEHENEDDAGNDESRDIDRQISFFGDISDRLENASKQFSKIMSFAPAIGMKARKKNNPKS
jgi:hypothetical protein